MTFLYSGNYPTSKASELKNLDFFIAWLEKHGFYTPPRARHELNVAMPFQPSTLVRSVATQLGSELHKMYGIGTWELHKKV
jgi:hypothetical protein